MEYTQIESLVITSDGRRQIGEMAAAEGLDSVISQHLALLDLSDEWRWEIESARLEKLRDMAEKDGDAGQLYQDADKRMKRALRAQGVEVEAAVEEPGLEPGLETGAAPADPKPVYSTTELGF